MFYDTLKNDHGFAVDPFKSVVAPRPIAWISSVSTVGIFNLAPYSFFNAFSEHPHYIAFGSDGRKDSLVNIEATGDFAVNFVNMALHDPMNASSAPVQDAVDEFQLAGVTPVSCTLIKAPRVLESPTALECRYHATVPLPDAQGHATQYLVIGQVMGVHIDDQYIQDGRVNTAAMKLIARLGYSEYTTVETAWRMRRPSA